MSGQIMSRLNTETKFAIRDTVINSLKAIGVSDSQIRDAQATWIAVYCNMLLSDIITEATTTLPSASDEVIKLPRNREYDLPEPTTVEEWVNSHSLRNDRLTRLLEEYRKLWTTGSMTDPSIIPFNRSLRTLPPQ